MNVLVAGGTGFVGKKLIAKLHEQGYKTYVLTRNANEKINDRNNTYIDYQYPVDKLPTIDYVINLAGESLFGYWTESKKKKILDSRIDTTNIIIDIMKQLPKKPQAFINGSAIGFYGPSNEIIFTEETKSPGTDFLAQVVVKWENEAAKATKLNIRTIFARFGVILGRKGALPYMSLPVKMFVGGKVGSGEQWTSWIHIDDVVAAILFSMVNQHIEGPLNITAPHPKRNKEFMKTLAEVLHRPYWLPAPTLAISALAGEMSQLVLDGQFVLPKKLQDYGFQFSHPLLEDALTAITK